MSVSKLLNNSFKPATSSVVMVRAMAIKPIFLNLVMPANSLKRLKTTLSSFVFGATFGSATHGCFKTWVADRRFFGSGLSMARMSSLASELIFGHGALSRSRAPCKMASKMPCSVWAQKGGTPESRMYKMTPHDHTSDAFE